MAGADASLSFQLEQPAQLVLAFLNREYAALLSGEEEQRAAESAYIRAVFEREGLLFVREMILHVLVCKQEQGFDPVQRLAAYTFAHGLFEADRQTRYTEKAALETSVIGLIGMERMTARWNALLAGHEAQTPPPHRDDLFEALLADAAEAGYPFALSFCQEYASLSHLLKSFAVEMIRRRVLLKCCQGCGRYFLAAESAEGYCAAPCPENPAVSCREQAGVARPAPVERNDEIARLYKQIYNTKANRSKRSGEERLAKELDDFKAQARQWRLRIRGGTAEPAEYYEWLQGVR
ncbi:MAG: DUF6076 domain-containing protein [Oscillospiraceae bacterium]|jgi:hypothetical protein|nr:DUF6076 domain-containing protein [Oscillospiraceae bacterium]